MGIAAPELAELPLHITQDDLDRIAALGVNALECRVERHHWPRDSRAPQCIVLEEWGDGSVRLGQRRRACLYGCGVVRIDTYYWHSPRDWPVRVGRPRYEYPTDQVYLFALDGEPKPSPAVLRAVLEARRWGAAPVTPKRRRARKG